MVENEDKVKWANIRERTNLPVWTASFIRSSSLVPVNSEGAQERLVYTTMPLTGHWK